MGSTNENSDHVHSKRHYWVYNILFLSRKTSLIYVYFNSMLYRLYRIVSIIFSATVQEWDGSYTMEKDEKEESEMLKSDRNRSISFNAYTN